METVSKPHGKSVWEYTVTRRKTLEMREDYKANGPSEVAEVLKGLGLADREQEVFICLLLDAKNGVKGYVTVTIGLAWIPTLALAVNTTGIARLVRPRRAAPVGA